MLGAAATDVIMEHTCPKDTLDTETKAMDVNTGLDLWREAPEEER